MQKFELIPDGKIPTQRIMLLSHGIPRIGDELLVEFVGEKPNELYKITRIIWFSRKLKELGEWDRVSVPCVEGEKVSGIKP